MMLGNSNPQMRGALLVAECAAHRRRTQPLPARAFVHKALVDEQLIDIERRAGIFRFAFRVGDRAAQQLFDRPCRALRREPQRLQRVLHLAPANQVDHQARLLRRHAHVLCERVRFDCCLLPVVRQPCLMPSALVRRLPLLEPRPPPSRAPLSPSGL